MSERTLRISARMAEEIQQWASDELSQWPRDTAYAADLESLLAQLTAAQPAPDAVAEAMPPLAWLYAGYGRSVSIPPGYEILEPDPVCDAMLKHNGVVLARDEDAKLRDLAQRHFESVNAWYALAKGTRP